MAKLWLVNRVARGAPHLPDRGGREGSALRTSALQLGGEVGASTQWGGGVGTSAPWGTPTRTWDFSRSGALWLNGQAIMDSKTMIVSNTQCFVSIFKGKHRLRVGFLNK